MKKNSYGAQYTNVTIEWKWILTVREAKVTIGWKQILTVRGIQT